MCMGGCGSYYPVLNGMHNYTCLLFPTELVHVVDNIQYNPCNYGSG